MGKSKLVSETMQLVAISNFSLLAVVWNLGILFQLQCCFSLMFRLVEIRPQIEILSLVVVFITKSKKS